MALDTVAKLANPRWFFGHRGDNAGSELHTISNLGLPGTGYPPPFSLGSPGLAGTATTSNDGGGMRCPAYGGSKNTHLVGFINGVRSTGDAAYGFMDMLWYNSGLVLTTTTAQTINSVAWPARDLTGTTDGVGVFVGLMWTGGSGWSGTSITGMTMDYTNSDGTAGRTATLFNWFNGIAPWGMSIMELQAGDVGVRSIQSFTFSASLGATGSCRLVAFRPICMQSKNMQGGAAGYSDAFAIGMPQIPDNAVLCPMYYGGVGNTVAMTEYGAAFVQV